MSNVAINANLSECHSKMKELSKTVEAVRETKVEL